MVIALFVNIEWHWHWPKLWLIVDGATQAAHARGARVVIYSNPGDSRTNCIGDLRRIEREHAAGKQQMDGLVMAFPDGPSEAYAEVLHQRGVPVVLIGRRAGATPRVLCDNFGAVRGLVGSLAKRGHTRIAFLSGRQDNLCATERQRGYLAGLQDAGLPHDPALVIEGDMNEQPAYENTARKLQAGLNCTVLIAVNDRSAMGAMNALREAGRKIPEEVEVIGFDNIPQTHWTTPPLSTFEMQAFHLGHHAAAELIDMIEGRPMQEEAAFDPVYIPRATTRDAREEPASSLQPCINGWSEELFQRETERARFLAQPDAAPLLAQLQTSAGVELYPLFERLQRIATKERLPVGVLYPFLSDAASARETDVHDVEKCLALLANAAIEEQKRQIEQGVIFASVILPLRDLRESAASDREVVACLGEVLKGLQIHKATLFLNDHSGADAWAESGTAWDIGPEGADARVVPAPDLGNFLARRTDLSTVFVMPLRHQDRQFGLMLIGTKSEFLTYYPNLVTELASTFHGTRTQRARTLAEAALRESKVQYQAVFDGSNDAVLLWDSDRFIDCNARAATLFGCDKDKLLQLTPSALSPARQPDGRDSATAARDYAECALGKGYCQFEWIHQRADGTEFPSEIVLSSFELRGRRIIHSTVRDITDRKEAEKARREMEERLQLSSKLESVGSLAAGVAHEINTPTQFISDNTRFLLNAFQQLTAAYASHRPLRECAAAHADCAAALAAIASAEDANEVNYLLEEIPRCLEQSLDGLRRIAKIVGSLKEFSHPGGDKRSKADLNRAIETTVAVSRHEWKYVADIATELAPALPEVNCVIDEINQAVLNLIINAAHAIGEANKQRGEARGRITLRSYVQNGYVVIEVADTGTGIPDNIRHRIFEPFFTTKGVGKGTGQGLSIVHTVVVKHHDGTVDFVTEPGKGTTFRLGLPLTPPGTEEQGSLA